MKRFCLFGFTRWLCLPFPYNYCCCGIGSDFSRQTLIRLLFNTTFFILFSSLRQLDCQVGHPRHYGVGPSSHHGQIHDRLPLQEPAERGGGGGGGGGEEGEVAQGGKQEGHGGASGGANGLLHGNTSVIIVEKKTKK